MNMIYFDNSATTPVCAEAREAAMTAMGEKFGNPGAVHHLGVEAFRALNSSREVLAHALAVDTDEVYFTSGATESNNTAIFGAAYMGGKQRRRILVSAVEHPSVSEPAKYLQNRGFDVQFIPVDQQGVVRLDALTELLDEQTSLVSVMQVNNETGSVQPLTEIGMLVRKLAPKAVFHIDGVQAFGRLPVDLSHWQADAYSASGHKLHAPKGIGLLWVRKGCRLPTLLQGGGQEHGFRSGTENMPGICAFAAAVAVANEDLLAQEALLRAVKSTLIDALSNALPQLAINGQSPDVAAPHIVNISFDGLRSEVLLHSLEQRGLYVSAGSACNSRSSKGSPVLTAMNLPPARVDSALRFSFSRMNTVEEAERAAMIIVETVQELHTVMSFKRGLR